MEAETRRRLEYLLIEPIQYYYLLHFLRGKLYEEKTLNRREILQETSKFNRHYRAASYDGFIEQDLSRMS
jgi:hypothetical protein